MSENWVDSLYSRLVLRDLFGKIIPGFILLSALLASLEPVAKVDVKDLPWAAWVLAFGFAWITGFGIQSFGEHVTIRGRRLLSYYPDGVTDAQFREKLVNFVKLPDYEKYKQDHERLVVIKEACANTYLALIFATIILLMDLGDLLSTFSVFDLISIALLDGGLIYFLREMHFKHVDRQYVYLEKAIAASTSGPPPLPKATRSKSTARAPTPTN